MLYSYQYIFIILFVSVSNLFAMSALSGAPVMAYVPALAAGLLAAGLQTALMKRGRSIGDINRAAFGRGGTVISAVYALWFIFSGGCVLGLYAAVTTDTVLYGMSPVLFVAIMGAAVIYVAARRPESLGRMAVLIGSVIFAAAVTALIMALGAGDVRRLISPRSINGMAGASAAMAALQFADMFCVITFLPMVTERSALYKKTLISVLCGGLFVALFAASEIMISGYPSGGAYLRVSRSGTFSQMIGGIKLLITCAYFFSVVFRISVTTKAACECIVRPVFRGSHKWAAAVCGAAVAAAALAAGGGAEETAAFLAAFYPAAALAVTCGIPALSLLIIWIKKRRGRAYASAFTKCGMPPSRLGEDKKSD